GPMTPVTSNAIVAPITATAGGTRSRASATTAPSVTASVHQASQPITCVIAWLEAKGQGASCQREGDGYCPHARLATHQIPCPTLTPPAETAAPSAPPPAPRAPAHTPRSRTAAAGPACYSAAARPGSPSPARRPPAGSPPARTCPTPSGTAL